MEEQDMSSIEKVTSEQVRGGPPPGSPARQRKRSC
jgi:hypothetical protein